MYGTPTELSINDLMKSLVFLGLELALTLIKSITGSLSGLIWDLKVGSKKPCAWWILDPIRVSG